MFMVTSDYGPICDHTTLRNVVAAGPPPACMVTTCFFMTDNLRDDSLLSYREGIIREIYMCVRTCSLMVLTPSLPSSLSAAGRTSMRPQESM